MGQRRAAAHGKLVLLVGGDQEIARSCARAACLPVIRARGVAVAADHVRSMHPSLVLVASDITQEDAAHLERIAGSRARVLHIDGATDLDADVRRAVGAR